MLIGKELITPTLKTRIKVLAMTEQTDEDGFKISKWTNVFNSVVYCKWETTPNAQNTVSNAKAALIKRATLLMRYTEKIDETCRIERDGKNYEVIDVNDPDGDKLWLNVTVQREAKAV